MKSGSGILISMIVASLLLGALSPAVRADGMPLTKLEVHGTLRENRQLAYITVNEDGESETLDLFLSVVSLEPGNNISIMIPLRTAPESVRGAELTEHEFRLERDYDYILKQAERQNRGMRRLGETTSEVAEDMAALQTFGVLYFMVMTVGYGGGAGGDYYDIAEGISMEVLSFNSTDSLTEFYNEQGVPVPERVGEIIEEYGDYNLGIINAVTRPPINEEIFRRIEDGCPTQLRDFKAFVEENPSIEVYDYWTYDYGYPYFYDGRDAELNSILRSIQDERLRYEFGRLIMATYGLGQNDGALISFELPLYDGQAFFPLGTTPAWQGVHRTEVIFEIPDNLAIDFNHGGQECFLEDRHYYTWQFVYEAPDYDLEGDVGKAGLGTDINRFGRSTNEWVYANAGSLAFIISVLLFGALWSLFLWIISRIKCWKRGGFGQKSELILLGFTCLAVSALGTIAFGLAVAAAGMYSMERRYLPIGIPGTNERRILGIELVFWIMIGFVGLIHLIGIFEENPLFLTGTIGSVGILVYYALIRIFPESHDKALSWTVWGIYMASLLPGLAFASGEGVCLTFFLALGLVLTTLFMLLMKEPRHNVPRERPSDD